MFGAPRASKSSTVCSRSSEEKIFVCSVGTLVPARKCQSRENTAGKAGYSNSTFVWTPPSSRFANGEAEARGHHSFKVLHLASTDLGVHLAWCPEPKQLLVALLWLMPAHLGATLSAWVQGDGAEHLALLLHHPSSSSACLFPRRGCVIGPTFHFDVPSLRFGDVPFGECALGR